MKDVKVGFIGFGNIASAMCKGLLKSCFLAKNIFACAVDYEKLEMNCRALGINACKTAYETVEASDVVFIAVKPYQVMSVLRECRELVTKKPFISLAAGVYCEDFNKEFGSFRHISAIPSVAIAVCEGITICEHKHTLNKLDMDLTFALLESVGEVFSLPTDKMDIGSSLGGCTPAFIAMFAEALADAGVMHGLKRDTANRIAAQALTGAGELLKQKINPEELKDSVCSPGGTTIRGVAQLEKAAFRSTVISAITATQKDNLK